MKIGDKVSVSHPDWLDTKTGTVIAIYETRYEKHYVVEFPGIDKSIVHTYREAEIEAAEGL